MLNRFFEKEVDKNKPGTIGVEELISFEKLAVFENLLDLSRKCLQIGSMSNLSQNLISIASQALSQAQIIIIISKPTLA